MALLHVHNAPHLLKINHYRPVPATQTTVATIVAETAANTAAGRNNPPVMATEVRVAKMPAAGVKAP